LASPIRIKSLLLIFTQEIPMPKHTAIAIDGPSGAGKSTLARAVADKLGVIYVDTGALYRAVGLYVHEAGVSLDEIAKAIRLLSGIKIELARVDGLQRVTLNGRDVSEEIRRQDISMYASAVSALPEVRAFLLDLQRSAAAHADCIMDGRDIGTVVLPDAKLKIFLTASPEDRARRRYDEYIAAGKPADYDEILAQTIKRDSDDSTRAAAPLRSHPDAVRLDTTGNTFEQSFVILLEMCRKAFEV